MKDNQFDDEVAHFSALANTWWDPNGDLKTLHDINPSRLSFIDSYVSLEGLSVLDLGCGGGILTEALAKKGATTTGLDASLDLINVAKKHAAESHLEIAYDACLVESYEHEPFDVIVCMEMLEHVPSPLSILKNAARLLKDDGWLFLSTINRSWKAYLSLIIGAEYILGILPKQTHDYSKFIKPSELMRDAQNASLEVKAIRGLFYEPFTRTSRLTDDVSVNYLLALRKG